MGSVLALNSFKIGFGLPADTSGFASARNAQIASNVVSLLTAGCFFGAIAAAFLNEKFGRRYSLMGFAIVFLIGAAVQTSAQHDLSYIYAGRVVAGQELAACQASRPFSSQ
jgi:MFS family permease